MLTPINTGVLPHPCDPYERIKPSIVYHSLDLRVNKYGTSAWEVIAIYFVGYNFTEPPLKLGRGSIYFYFFLLFTAIP